MLQQQVKIIKKIIIFIDQVIVAISFFLGCRLIEIIRDVELLDSYLYLLVFILPIWSLLLVFYGMYDSLRNMRIYEIIIIIAKAGITGILFFGGVAYLFKIQDISRILISVVFFITGGFLFILKILEGMYFKYTRRKGYNVRNLLVVGANSRVKRFIDLIHEHSEWGFKIIGLIDDDTEKKGTLFRDYPVLGTLDDMPDLIKKNLISEVVFIVPRSWLGKIEKAIIYCEMVGIKVHLAIDHFELKISRAFFSNLQEFPLITFNSTPDRMALLFLKRFLDIILSGFALLLLSPMLIVISTLIKLTSSGPVFYKQKRCGMYGKLFVLYKFRTMIDGADKKLKELLQHNEMSGPAFKMTNDPRITMIGGFLRKYSLDELPQLWNIFRGDMSIVGPRPPLFEEVNEYDCWQRRRLSVRPGLTCIWQVSGRNKITDFSEWARLDLEYIDNWSLWLDFKIMLKTIPAVILGVGAK